MSTKLNTPSDNAKNGPKKNPKVGPYNSVTNGLTNNLKGGPYDTVKIGPTNKAKNDPTNNVKNDPSDNVESGPADNSKNGPTDNVENVPTDNVENVPTDNVENVPTDNVENVPTDNTKKDSTNNAGNGPISLNYDLRSRLTSNVIFWSFVLATVVIIPIVLYYPLTYCTKLDVGTILGFTSISIGLPSMFQLPFRFWQLWKQDGGDRRPLSGHIMDLFMWEYVFNFILLTIVYVVSTSIPIPQLFLMIPSILVGNVGIQLFLSLLQPPAPIWISSLPPGHKIRPAGYYIMEDIVSVDGDGGSAYRRALNQRYESSPIFQCLVYEMTMFWAIGGLVFVGVSVAFAFGTSLNFAFGATLIWIPVWALLGFLPAVFWAHWRLNQETDSFRLKQNQISP
ncbi:unnamed protein product [Rotaria magnacalcarata]|uniref:Uncharacterized protein n=4 Tax=Rotaria magnacalcarata TaxID=392030 RepID=A0A816V7B3_9BILA|nr:unnamed protein product [Rotaria magnacalcarata]CAF3919437.1 unnamed protein product [Rotaria magnacalcarata]CAF4151657.1 unnamed protein product [Rotaria magnacalcarata]